MLPSTVLGSLLQLRRENAKVRRHDEAKLAGCLPRPAKQGGEGVRFLAQAGVHRTGTPSFVGLAPNCCVGSLGRTKGGCIGRRRWLTGFGLHSFCRCRRLRLAIGVVPRVC